MGGGGGGVWGVVDRRPGPGLHPESCLPSPGAAQHCSGPSAEFGLKLQGWFAQQCLLKPKVFVLSLSPPGFKLWALRSLASLPEERKGEGREKAFSSLSCACVPEGMPLPTAAQQTPLFPPGTRTGSCAHWGVGAAKGNGTGALGREGRNGCWVDCMVSATVGLGTGPCQL